MDTTTARRKTTQELASGVIEPTPAGQYNIYPAFPVGAGKINLGFEALAERLAGRKQVVLDGYVGVFWDEIRERLGEHLSAHGLEVSWRRIEEALRPEREIDARIEPFLGGDDPLFGTRFTGRLGDFLDQQKLRAIRPDPAADLSVVYGCGAALAGWNDAFLVYLDVPKNEIQFRSRAGAVCNLGARKPLLPKQMYKRFYFVDWPALNHHKRDLLPEIDLIVDAQRPDIPALMTGVDLRAGLTEMSRNYFRVRPWFEPGAWGGHWIEKNIPQLPQDVPNYAWSFELIVPENGLTFESDGRCLEVSFDLLMYHDCEAVLGDSAELFGYDFPIRFDFLDTVEGGKLSLQCHPRPAFIHEHFGERFAQDETYYILDCEPEAEVYLGFREDIDPKAFREALERSAREGKEVDVEQFVHAEPAKRHDFFLIPNGTIHCSGEGNLVLEISATPYIFTFKIYDWMRLDLDGRPRPLNIERAFENLRFDRKGARGREELVARPSVLEEGEDWRLIHLPTHPEHFYDVHRFDFERVVEAATNGSPHVMNLVEGTSVLLETQRGRRQRVNYAETFVVPAAAERYRLINEGDAPAKVVKAFIKPDVTADSDFWGERVFTS